MKLRLLVIVTTFAALVAPPAVAAALSAECGPAPKGALCLDGAWFAFSTLKVEVRQGSVTSRYEVTLGTGRDILARTEQSTPRYSGRADVLLVDGTTIVYRNDRSLPGEGQELLNQPLLAAQEVASFLQAALPKGPKQVRKSIPIRATGTRIVAMRTPAMSSYFGPPWTVEGTITPGRDGDLDFDFTVSFRLAKPDGTVTANGYQHRYRGRIGFPAARPRVPDALDLAGWTLNLPPGTMQGSTLGDLRRSLGLPAAK